MKSYIKSDVVRFGENETVELFDEAPLWKSRRELVLLNSVPTELDALSS